MFIRMVLSDSGNISVVSFPYYYHKMISVTSFKTKVAGQATIQNSPLWDSNPRPPAY